MSDTNPIRSCPSWTFDESAAPRVHFVLVHGTWGQHTPFAIPGSEFTRWIAESMEVPGCFHRFEWSGKNSHRERLAAGERLSEFVSELRARDPGVPVVLLGHSHGGNVALYATRHDPPACSDAVITLATPFLIVKPRRLPVHRLGWTWGVPACTALTLCGLGGWMLWGGWAWGLFATIGLLLSLTAAVLLYRRAGAHGDVRVGAAEALTRWQDAAQQRLALPEHANRRVHAVTVRGDEALSLLRVFTVLQQAPYYVWHACVALSHAGLGLLVAGTVAAGASRMLPAGLTGDAMLWGGLGAAALSITSGVLVTLLPVLTLALPRVGFGNPGNLTELVMHVRAGKLPTGGSVAVVHRVGLRPSVRLRHLHVCRRRDVADLLAGWI